MNTKIYLPVEVCFKEVIHFAWQLDQNTSFEKEYIIPKGITEIIFNFNNSTPTVARLNGSPYHLPNCFINGFNTSPIQLQLPEKQHLFGVVFQPMAIKKIFRVPAGEFSDLTVDLTLIDKNFHTLWHKLAEQDDFNNRVTIFLNWLKPKLSLTQPRDQMINQYLYGFEQHGLSVKELANTICYSQRQLSRKITEATGMNTEEMLLYKKYLHAVHLMHHTDLSLTAIAYDSQFYDQSHFIKSFRHYTNMTPGEYRQAKGMVKGHMYKDVR